MVEISATTAAMAHGQADATITLSARKLLPKSSFSELRATMLEEASKELLEGPATPPESPGNAGERLKGDPCSVCSYKTNSKANSIASDADVEHNALHLKPVDSAWLSRQFSNRHRQQVPSTVEEIRITSEATGPRSAKLQCDCQRGIEFLRRLQLPMDSRMNASSEPVLPKTALRFSKGLAFMWQRKAGLLASYTWGSGFVIARTGPKSWSAPCFIKDRFLSLGATAGFRTLDTLYAIPTDDGIRPFDTNYAKMAVDLAITLDFDPMQLDMPVAVRKVGRQLPAHRVDPSEQPKAYTMTDGLIMDVSWRIGAHLVDCKQNEDVYGVGVTAAQILEGETDIPEEFLSLYDTINELASSATLVRDTPSLFELEKAKLRSKGSFMRQIQREQLSGSSNSSIGAASMGASSVSSVETSADTSPRGPQNDVKSSENPFQLFPGIEIDLDAPLTVVPEELGNNVI